MSARVIEAERHFVSAIGADDLLEHTERTFFVASESEPGAWWKVEFVPSRSLTCPCPYGRRIAAQPVTPQMKLCRHLQAVAERLLAERTAVA